MATLEDLNQQQNEELKEQKKILIEQLGQTAKNTSLSAKDRAKAARQQDQLIKSDKTLGSDLKKNYQDLRDGLSTTIDGVINETFGPFGGIVSSFTTGFFKRGKENKDNLTANEIQVEQSKELLSELGGQSEVITDQNEKLTSIDENIAFMAGNQETAEDREERMRKAAEAGGEVAEPTKEEKEGFGMMLLKFLGLVLSAAAGLAVGAATGIVKYLTDIVKLIGTPIIKMIKAIPNGMQIIIDDVVKLFSADGMVGKTFTKIKTFFMGENTFFKRITTIIDNVTDSLKGYTGGLFTKINDFFGGENSIFKRTAAILDPVIESVKGFTGGLFTKIQNFFTGETSVFKRIGTVVDTVIDSVKGFGGKVFTTIKDIFSSVADVGKQLAAPFKGILDFFPGGKGEGGIISKILDFLSPFKAVFKAAASLGAKLVAPLNIIIGIFDAGFETKDAVDKSNGLFPSLLNGLIGAIGGFFDGAVLQLVDFLKDGVATVVGFFGFEGAEKALKDFSFSAKFNEFLDQIYSFVNNLFDFDLAAIANSIIPEDSFLRKFVPESLFQSADKAVEKTTNLARGGVIVNRPSYLPSSGVVVGEAKTYTGRGLAYGGAIPMDGGPEAVIPLSGPQAQAFIEPVARAIAVFLFPDVCTIFDLRAITAHPRSICEQVLRGFR